jgi:hypothetical protein
MKIEQARGVRNIRDFSSVLNDFRPKLICRKPSPVCTENLIRLD